MITGVWFGFGGTPLAAADGGCACVDIEEGSAAPDDGLQAEAESESESESDSDSELNLMPNSNACKLGAPGFGMDDAFRFSGKPKHP